MFQDLFYPVTEGASHSGVCWHRPQSCNPLSAPLTGVYAVVRMHRRHRVEQIGHYAYIAAVETCLLSVMTEMVALRHTTPSEGIRGKCPIREGHPGMGRFHTKRARSPDFLRYRSGKLFKLLNSHKSHTVYYRFTCPALDIRGVWGFLREFSCARTGNFNQGTCPTLLFLSCPFGQKMSEVQTKYLKRFFPEPVGS